MVVLELYWHLVLQTTVYIIYIMVKLNLCLLSGVTKKLFILLSGQYDKEIPLAAKSGDYSN
jgi:hypothetical protein